MQLKNIPPEMRVLDHWLVWRLEKRGGGKKLTKVPYHPCGGRAKTNDPTTWCNFAAAVAAYESGSFDGIGFVLSGTPYIGVDIDNCYNPQTREFSAAAQEIILLLDSYTEFSQSGRGLHIIVRGRLPTGRRRKGSVEMYGDGSPRYFAMTGDTLAEPLTIRVGQTEIEAVHAQYIADQPEPVRVATSSQVAATVALPDEELFDKARAAKNGPAFARLFDQGDWSGYSSHSEADLALCNLLAFWCGNDPGQMDRLFRRSGLMRKKWDRPQSGSTYGALTLQKALTNCRDMYSGRTKMAMARDELSDQMTPAKEVLTPRLQVISALELQAAVLPPVTFWIEGMLPEGTAMLSAASKIGKSWLVLDLGLCIAAGRPFLGAKVKQAGVLYLALEDSLQRLQDRMSKVLNGEAAPEHFYFTTEAPRLDDGLLDSLDIYLASHPDVKLVIIDTLQKIRGQALPRETPYAQDYREIGVFKDHMSRKGISLFFVHHNRKMKDADDPFNMISGTNGIMGAADTSWLITKDKRADDSATLHITGRDISQSSTVVRFNRDTWHWDKIGDADWLVEQNARQTYQSSPLVLTIRKLLEQSPDGRWAGTAKDLLAAGRFLTHALIAPTAQSLGYELKALDQALFEYDNIVHSAPSNGTGGKKHYFYRDSSPFDAWEQKDLPFSKR